MTSDSGSAINARAGPPPLNIWEKLDIIPAFASMLVTAPYKAIAAIFRGKGGAKKYSVHLWHSLAREITRRLSMRQTL